jgi:Chalcone isomerase-like
MLLRSRLYPKEHRPCAIHTTKTIVRNVLIAVTLAVFFINIAIAAMPSAAQLPDAKPSATVRLRVWGFSIYDAKLWVQRGFKAEGFEQERFGLELRYLRSLKRADIAQRSIAEMRRFAPIGQAKADLWLARMLESFPDVQDGDTLVGVNKPGVGASFYMNGKLLGEVNDPEFARLFFSIWLHPNSSEQGMRRAMLESLSAP